MFEYLQNWLGHIESNYGVNPVIFAILYCAGVIPFWLSVYKIINAIKRRDRKKLVSFIVVLGVVIISPFTYVAIFGKNLPAWFWIVAAVIIAYSVNSVLRRIRTTQKAS